MNVLVVIDRSGADHETQTPVPNSLDIALPSMAVCLNSRVVCLGESRLSRLDGMQHSERRPACAASRAHPGCSCVQTECAKLGVIGSGDIYMHACSVYCSRGHIQVVQHRLDVVRDVVLVVGSSKIVHATSLRQQSVPNPGSWHMR